MTAAVRVRTAAVADWQCVRSLRLAALADEPDAFGSTLAQERDQPPAFWQTRLRGEAITLIASVDERDAGVAVIASSGISSDVAGLYAVWVAPHARGRGAGDALIRAALAAATDAGYARIVLDVGDYNEPAQRLYRRCGFLPTGRRSTLPAPREHIAEHELSRPLPP